VRYPIVRNLLLASTLALSTALALPVLAQSPVQPAAQAPKPVATQGAAQGKQQAAPSPAAEAAVKTVDGFMAALAGGQFETARQLMTQDAVVMANGVVLGPRDAYIAGPAKKVAAALQSSQRQLLDRKVDAGGNVALVLSEKLVKPAKQGVPAEVLIETMVLARTPQGWKVAHIHWSTRPAA